MMINFKKIAIKYHFLWRKVKMKVSVIIPCFNQERYIQEAIESVINQTYKNIEIICVNDGSSDNSSKIIRNLVNKYKNIYTKPDHFNEKIRKYLTFPTFYAII